MSHKCVKCEDEKSLTEFYFRNDTQSYRKECKICFNQAKKYYVKKIQLKMMKNLKIQIKHKLKYVLFVIKKNN